MSDLHHAVPFVCKTSSGTPNVLDPFNVTDHENNILLYNVDSGGHLLSIGTCRKFVPRAGFRHLGTYPKNPVGFLGTPT